MPEHDRRSRPGRASRRRRPDRPARRRRRAAGRRCRRPSSAGGRSSWPRRSERIAGAAGERSAWAANSASRGFVALRGAGGCRWPPRRSPSRIGDGSAALVRRSPPCAQASARRPTQVRSRFFDQRLAGQAARLFDRVGRHEGAEGIERLLRGSQRPAVGQHADRAHLEQPLGRRRRSRPPPQSRSTTSSTSRRPSALSAGHCSSNMIERRASESPVKRGSRSAAAPGDDPLAAGREAEDGVALGDHPVHHQQELGAAADREGLDAGEPGHLEPAPRPICGEVVGSETSPAPGAAVPRSIFATKPSSRTMKKR